MGIRNRWSSILSIGGNKRAKKIFLPVVLTFIAFLVVDILINFLSENTEAENISSQSWIILFVFLTAAFGIGQFFLLGFISEKIKEIEKKNPLVRITYYVVAIAQFVLFGVLLAACLQIVFTSSYSTFLLLIGNSISLGMAVGIMGILGRLFIGWSRTKNNFVVFLYGLSSIAISINMILTIAFYDPSLFQLQPIRTSKSEVKFPIFDPHSAMGIIQGLQGLTALIYFDLWWVSTAFLLQHYSKKVGKIKFWSMMIIPLALFTIQFIVIFPYFAVNPQHNIIYVVLGFSLPGLASGVLFAIPFWTVSRATRPAIVSNYLLIAAIGVILFQFSTLAAVVYGPYPPFGLASVTITGLSSFFMLIGLYSSAISTAQDTALRQSIRKAITKEVEMIGIIGTAEMEQRLTKNVMVMVKNDLDQMYEETGVQPSYKDEELRGYLEVVTMEIKRSGFVDPYYKQKEHTRANNESGGRDTEAE